MDGLGVAIAQVAFVIDELRAGSSSTTNSPIFFVFPKHCAETEKIRQFQTWAAHEAAVTRQNGSAFAL